MISERTLRKWRKDALSGMFRPTPENTNYIELIDRVLKLTQELLDQHLLRKGEGK